MKRKKDVVWCFECKYYDNTAKAPFMIVLFGQGMKKKWEKTMAVLLERGSRKNGIKRYPCMVLKRNLVGRMSSAMCFSIFKKNSPENLPGYFA